MTRKLLLSILAMMTLQAVALDVENTAGELYKKVNDLNVSTLRITGTINAVDFYYMSDYLCQLTDLDLGDVEVLSCNLPVMRYMKNHCDADELPVAALGSMKLTRLVLPTGLKVIGKGALADCDQLTQITLPPKLERIDDYAFAGCSALTDVTLPASVTTVGVGAFMRCTALTTLTTEASSNLTTLGDAALMDCPALRTISLGTALESVGERALAGTGLQELNLSENRSLTTISDWAMVQTPVQQAKLPSDLTNLGIGVFLYDTRLTGINLGNKLTAMSDFLLAGTGLTDTLSLPIVRKVGDYAFYNVSSLKSVVLPATVTWLGDSAMAGMTGLTSLVCRAPEVPDLGEHVWAGVDQSRVPLEVPVSSRASYKEAAQWQDFIIGNTWIKGDVNGDGEVNLADINALTDIILRGYADEETMARADVNGDGEVNLADINALTDLILKSGGAKLFKSKKSKRHGKK